MRYHGGNGGQILQAEDTDDRARLPTDSASNALLQVCDVEIDQEADASATQFQVRQALGCVHGKDPLNRLYFDDDGVFDQKIDAVTELERNVIVFDRKDLLGFKADVGFFQLVSEARAVCPLEQAGPSLEWILKAALRMPSVIQPYTSCPPLVPVSSVVELF